MKVFYHYHLRFDAAIASQIGIDIDILVLTLCNGSALARQRRSNFDLTSNPITILDNRPPHASLEAAQQNAAVDSPIGV